VERNDHERTVAKRKRGQEALLLRVCKDPDARVILFEELHPADRITLSLGGLGLHRAVECHLEERQVAVHAGWRQVPAKLDAQLLHVMRVDVRDRTPSKTPEQTSHPGFVVLGRSLVLAAVDEKLLRDLVEQDDTLRDRLGEEPSLSDLRLPLR
jgi:hypothetical protein